MSTEKKVGKFTVEEIPVAGTEISPRPKGTVRTLDGRVFIECEINREDNHAHKTKSDLRPFGGWPDDVDPYPDLSDDAIVQTAIFNVKFHLKGFQVAGDLLKHADQFTLDFTGVEDSIGAASHKFQVIRTVQQAGKLPFVEAM